MNNNRCFQYCSNCKLSSNCCTNFKKINAPVCNYKEIKKIKEKTNLDKFYNIIDKDLYTLKIKEGKCIFFVNHKCNIYNIRPTDCRLFPYDIVNLNNKYYLILYKLNCINIENFLNIPNSIESLIKDILPWISNFTDKRNYDKMNKIDYVILKEIKKES